MEPGRSNRHYYNRTYVELKLQCQNNNTNPLNHYNRTYVELKCGQVPCGQRRCQL